MKIMLSTWYEGGSPGDVIDVDDTVGRIMIADGQGREAPPEDDAAPAPEAPPEDDAAPAPDDSAGIMSKPGLGADESATTASGAPPDQAPVSDTPGK